MLVSRLFIDNPLRNFNYLVACPETGEALAIDPLEVDAVLADAAARGWTIRQILCTHDHWDHAGGRAQLSAATGARVLAHAASPLDGVDLGLRHGDPVQVGSSVTLTALDTPGHTMSHICLVGGGHLFAGDTVFAGGCGNCRHGGHPQALWQTFRDVIYALPDGLILDAGHDYAVNNFGFSLDREPGNAATEAGLADATALASRGEQLTTTLAAERTWNPFFRLRSEILRDRLGVSADEPDEAVFIALREARNHW